MFDKVKGLLAIEGQLEKLQEEIGNCNLIIREHGKEVADLHQKLTLLHEKTVQLGHLNKEMSQGMGSDILSIKSIRTGLEHELAELRMLRANFEKTVAERVSAQVEAGLREHLERLKTDVQQYNALKTDFEGLRQQLQMLKQEIAKLQEIASSIKQKDFEMTKFAHQLLGEDRHKIDLMRQIETLEKVIAAERRKSNQRNSSGYVR